VNLSLSDPDNLVGKCPRTGLLVETNGCSGYSQVLTRLERDHGMITIELFGVPRLRAGVASVQVEAGSVAAALRGLGRLCPALDGPVVAGGTLHPAYLACKNGTEFVSDPATTLADGDVLLVMAADVGG
jgi:molybdopterin converting factor small subunit